MHTQGLKAFAKSGLKYLICFITLILTYVLLLTLVWTIPRHAIEENRKATIAYIEDAEGLYPSFFYGGANSTLDNYSDRSMMRHVVPKKGYNALENAMWGKNYARYWHGYQLFLRPLLATSSYPQIRLITTMIFSILFFSCFYLLCKRMGFLVGAAFVFSMIAVNFILLPVSLQYNNMFTLLFVTMIAALLFYQKNRNWTLFFFIVGSLTNFFDYLTTPVITLGLPLIIIALLDAKETAPRKQLINIVKYSTAWTLAYAMTWFTKWLLASIVLKKDIITDAFQTIFFRVNGNEEMPVSRLATIKLNFDVFLSRRLMLLLIIIFVLIGIGIIKAHKDWRKCLSYLPILLITFYPYIWYLVLSNHSQIHVIFTYRNQIISLFALISVGLCCIDFNKLKIYTSLKKLYATK